MSNENYTPVHQWTHDGKDVLLLKCVALDGIAYAGFIWPESGPVEPEEWDAAPECGNGLHGWPWGIGIGGGTAPNYRSRWIVFAAKPEDVVNIDDEKAKCRKATVVYSGDWWTAWAMVREGQVAWIEDASRRAASSTGDSGAASSTGVRGAASSTGDSGAASSTGVRGAASSTGYRGAASSTGDGSVAAVTIANEDSTVEAGAGGICAVVGVAVKWRVHKSALLVQRWRHGNGWRSAVLYGRDFRHGATVLVMRGAVASDE